MPATWDMYGVDANGDGVKDPFNPVDAIFAAARYLRAAGGDQDIRRAVFAYNHADWYVDSVLMRAQVIGGLPSDLVGSLTGLTQGRFPVHAKATYAGQLTKKGNKVRTGNAAMVVESEHAAAASGSSPRPARRSSPPTTARSSRSATASASATSSVLQDVYGNTYTYGAPRRRSPRPTPRRSDRRPPPGRPRARPPRSRLRRRPTASAGSANANTPRQRRRAADDAPQPAAALHHQGAPVRPPGAPAAARRRRRRASSPSRSPTSSPRPRPLGFKPRDFARSR